MIVLNTAPPPERDSLEALYRRMPHEGMVHSSLMQGERYDRAEGFDDSLACAALTWSAGGEERYEFDRNDAVTVKSAGALCLATGARYAYAAHGERPFLSNMIVFPRWVAAQAAADPLTGDPYPDNLLRTRLFSPSRAMERIMTAFTRSCRNRAPDHGDADEQLAQLYRMLLDAQDQAQSRGHSIDAAKRSTQAELARRAVRAKQHILQCYDDPGLDLAGIARTACLSPYHLIRVFKAAVGETPMRHLQRVRLDAAYRLLIEMETPVSHTASAVGYGDRSAFCRAFTKRFGAAPSAIRH